MKKQIENQLEKKAEKKEEKKTDETDTKKSTVKKWKGKDWFTVLSPKMFGEKKIAETPCTDPKTIINRNIEVSLAEIIDQPAKYHMKLMLKITHIKDKSAFTRFNGYVVLKEFMMRHVRKGSQKITLIEYFDTKDGWKLQVTTTSVMNRNVDANIKRKMRHLTSEMLSKNLSKLGIDDFIRALIAGNIQRSIKKEGSKIYPVRFTEIEKVEVIKAGK